MALRDTVYRYPITILVIGVDGIGKSRMAASILDTIKRENALLNARILMNTSVPEVQEHYDLVVVMLDLTNAYSDAVFNGLLRLPEDVMMGKLCFAIIGTKYKYQNKNSYDSIVEKMALLDAPVFHSHLKADEDFAVLATHLVNTARVTSGLNPDVSPMLLSHFNRIILPDGVLGNDTMSMSMSTP